MFQGKGAMPQPAVPTNDPQFHLSPDEGTLTIEQAETTGGDATASVVVTPASNYHVNKEYPTKLTLEAPPSVKLRKSVLVGSDATTFTPSMRARGVPIAGV